MEMEEEEERGKVENRSHAINDCCNSFHYDNDNHIDH